MDSNKSGFAEHLDHLIELFRSLRKKHEANEKSEMDISLFKTVDLLLQNYDLIRSSVPREMLDQLGLPVKEVIVELIGILKEELGESQDEVVENIMGEIKAIDDLLQEKGLGMSEIDELLDARSELMRKQNKQDD